MMSNFEKKKILIIVNVQRKTIRRITTVKIIFYNFKLIKYQTKNVTKV